MRGRTRQGLAAALAAAALAGGCGGEGDAATVAPVRCVDGWNSQATSLRFGQHVYDEHESHRAQVAILEATVPNPYVPATGTCAAIFAVPESDYEYGTVGLVLTELGWARMSELARNDDAALERIQSEASGAANATLLPDGKLEAD